jgi:hypothetical protein
MRSISELAGQELAWAQPSAMKQTFELRSGEEVVARLEFQRSSLATAQTAGKIWTFKREGFWHPQVTVRPADSDQNEAIFRPSWAGGGSLELGNGRQLRFGAANFWHSQWDWQLPDGRSAVHYRSRSRILKSGAEVKVADDAGDLPELPLLVVLGWYLLVLFARDAAAASAASTAVIVSSSG